MIKNTRLSNGIEIPTIGLGTFNITDQNELETAIKTYSDAGTVLIDTASAYFNERAIGKAIKESGIPREKLFIQSKVWKTTMGYEETRKALEATLRKMKLDYLDCYLIHWPLTEADGDNWKEINLNTWKSIEKSYENGLIRSIGISNHTKTEIDFLTQNSYCFPMIHQFEFHPGHLNHALYNYCKTNKIKIESSSPLGNGTLLENKDILRIAEEKNKTISQIILRYCFQMDVIPVVRSKNREHIQENLEIFDFELSDNEMNQLMEIKEIGATY